jgi:hypothetical protein
MDKITKFRTLWNQSTEICNASVVKIYNATSILMRFEKTIIFFYVLFKTL